MANLAIIPARGGSKRIPRKNIKEFCGKPIIAYSILAALKTGLFEEVMVSTDDVEIAEVAKQYGAKVPFIRSEQNSNDFATTMDVVKEVTSEYQFRGHKFEFICCIYATAPLISVSDIMAGLEKISPGSFDSVFPVVAYGYPIWRSLKVGTDSRVDMFWPEYMNSRSQDLTPAYHDAGQWYWMRAEALNANIFSGSCAAIPLDETRVQDIDNETDWRLAELKYQMLNG